MCRYITSITLGAGLLCVSILPLSCWMHVCCLYVWLYFNSNQFSSKVYLYLWYGLVLGHPKTDIYVGAEIFNACYHLRGLLSFWLTVSQGASFEVFPTIPSQYSVRTTHTQSYFCSYVFDYYGRLPTSIYVIFISVAWLNSSINIFLYAGLNQNLRDAYGQLVRCQFKKLRNGIWAPWTNWFY